jgi:hypothetical protein
MDIPNLFHNSSGRITHEFQKAGIEALNQRTVVREALEQIDSPQSNQNVRLNSGPRPSVQGVPTVSVAGKTSKHAGTNFWALL